LKLKKIVIIGAGTAGLSAAVYLQRSGFEVTICEQHSIPGGFCTSWKRKGYLFEGAIHWMTGSSPKARHHQIWKQTGAISENTNIFLRDPFYALESDGKTMCLFRDIEKTAEHLIGFSPNDKKHIRSLANDVKTFSNIQMPILDIKGVKIHGPKLTKFSSLLKLLPAIFMLGRLNKQSIKEYAERFEHKDLRRMFRFMPEDYSAVGLVATLATFNTGDGGYPEGGSLAIAARMQKTFEDLGGKLLLKTKVKKVNIKNGAVTGVSLFNALENSALENNAPSDAPIGTLSSTPAGALSSTLSSELGADAVIITQETIAAIDQLLDLPKDSLDKWLKELKQNVNPAVCTFAGVGIRAILPQNPLPAWKLDEPIKHAGRTENEIHFYNYAGYEGYAPEGCSALTMFFIGDTYDYWKKAKDEGNYEKEKQALADQIGKALCRKYPQLEGRIDVIDIATPLTYERYTGSYHGSWMNVLGAGKKIRTYPGFTKNVSGLYFAGHRLTSPGGLPVAVNSGRKAAQLVCRQFGAVFNSISPEILS